jgi:23S rRNA pseudouridine955/2504/2580 synthase
MEEFTQSAPDQSLKTALLRQLNLANQRAGRLIADGQVKVNGVRTRKNIVLSPGDKVAVYLPASSPGPRLLYQGQGLIAVEKPPGTAVCDAPGLTVEALLHRNGFPTARAVHRLDVYTGGVLLLALNDEAEEALIELIRGRALTKLYQCVVKGRPAPAYARRRAYLLKDARAARVRILAQPAPNAREIVTAYDTLAYNDALSLLRVDLITGRTHQIRAHMASLGYPLLGDDLYGDRAFNKAQGVSHPLLWASDLAFPDHLPPPLEEVSGLHLHSAPRFPKSCPFRGV